MPLKVADAPCKGFAFCFWLGFCAPTRNFGGKRKVEGTRRFSKFLEGRPGLCRWDNLHWGPCGVALRCWAGNGGDVRTGRGAEGQRGTGPSVAAGSSERAEAGKTAATNTPGGIYESPSWCGQSC